MRQQLFTLLLILFVPTGEALADQILLKNGDRLTGTIVKSDGKTIVFKSDLVGEVSVALDSVTNVTSDKTLYVTLADGRTVAGVVNAKDGQAEIRSSTGPVVVERSAITIIRSEAEQQLYESTLNPGWLQQWTGGADLGLALTRGNSNTTNFALGMAISRETLRDKTSLYGASVYNRETSDGSFSHGRKYVSLRCALRSQHQSRLVWLRIYRPRAQWPSGSRSALGSRRRCWLSRDPQRAHEA